MEAGVDGAEDVAAIELSGGEEIQGGGEKADPGGAANGWEKKDMGIDAGMKEGVEELEEKRGAEDDAVLRGVGMSDGGNDVGVQYAIEECGDGEAEADERAGSADVEEGAGGANGGTDHDEGAESAD